MATDPPSGKGPRGLFCTFRAQDGQKLEGFSIDPRGIVTLRGPSGDVLPVEPGSSGIATHRADGSPRTLVSVPNSRVLSLDWSGALSRFDGLTPWTRRAPSTVIRAGASSSWRRSRKTCHRLKWHASMTWRASLKR